MTDLNCIVCDKTLEPQYEDSLYPLIGTEFSTTGHYGSPLDYDAFDTAVQFHIYICNDCLNSKKKSVVQSRTTKKVETQVLGTLDALWSANRS